MVIIEEIGILGGLVSAGVVAELSFLGQILMLEQGEVRDPIM
jgi:hypothetical protein